LPVDIDIEEMTRPGAIREERSIGVGIGAAAIGLPFITPYPWLLDVLALLSIPVGFAFPFLQIVYNQRSLSSMRRAGASEDEKSRLKAEMGAITPWYLLIGLVGNLIFLPVLMVTGRWYMLLGSSVGMIGTLVILYQLYRAGLFQPGDLFRLTAGSAAWAGLILAFSRSIPTDFWK